MSGKMFSIKILFILALTLICTAQLVKDNQPKSNSKKKFAFRYRGGSTDWLGDSCLPDCGLGKISWGRKYSRLGSLCIVQIMICGTPLFAIFLVFYWLHLPFAHYKFCSFHDFFGNPYFALFHFLHIPILRSQCSKAQKYNRAK